MTFLNRIRERLRDDTGSSLPEVMVSVLITAVSLGVMAGAITALGSLFNSATTTSASISETTVTDMRWRSDVHAAVQIAPTSDSQVKVTLPAAGGKCVEEVWAYSNATGLTITSTTYAALSGNACSGFSNPATTETVMPNTANAKFTYKNPGGRPITFNAGTGTLDTAAIKPAATVQSVWDSAVVAGGTLDASSTVNGLTRTVHSAQLATSILSAGSGAATAPVLNIASQQTLLQNPLVSVVAGNGTSGAPNDGADAKQASLTPTGVAVDSAGNIFVAEGSQNRIRKITPAGAISTYAGSGTSGSANGLGTAATFNNPRTIAVGTDGTTLFVADQGNNKIRKIVPSGAVGQVSDFVGNGTGASTDNTTGASASFYGPNSIAVAATGVLYVSDSGTNEIRSVAATSPFAVTTIAGTGSAGFVNGTGTAASFSGVSSIALDAAGTNLYVADTVNQAIRKIVIATKAVTTFAGGTLGSVDGSGTAAKFYSPRGVTVVGGTVYVADSSNNSVRAIDSSGVVSIVAGAFDLTGKYVDGSKTAARFKTPFAVSGDGKGGLLVADTGNLRIRSIR